MSDEIVVSTLKHTWILDIDGTIVKHNGYIIDGHDSFLPNALEFLKSIPEQDCVIFLTSRTEEYREMTISFLEENNVRFDHIIFNAPYGERVLLNDCKPSGLKMGLAINVKRDEGLNMRIIQDENL